jgi:hypothetical protein
MTIQSQRSGGESTVSLGMPVIVSAGLLKFRARARPAANGRAVAANALSRAAAPMDDGVMRHNLLLPALLALAIASGARAATPTPPTAAPAAASAPTPSFVDDKLELPKDYRQWIYLTSGFDMSYRPAATPDHHMFDNVFVDPASWRAFQATGTWPDKTMLVLEFRGARTRGSINKAGQFQDGDVMGVEVHVKDMARFAGQWAFFAFGDGTPAKRVPEGADCYSCHAAHGAVDTTFVQFYPTLLSVASARRTLSQGYRADDKATR